MCAIILQIHCKTQCQKFNIPRTLKSLLCCCLSKGSGLFVTRSSKVSYCAVITIRFGVDLANHYSEGRGLIFNSTA